MQTTINPKALVTIPLYALAVCVATMSAGLAGGDAPYGADSWKTLIADDCKAYFDGCNDCRRAEGSAVAACTRKACAAYRKPRCLDEPITEGSMGKTPFDGQLARFACDGDNRFRVYHGEYVSGDQRMRLGEDEIMLADEQTHSAYKLRRERAASGAKYSDGKLEFWEHGGEAMLRKNGEKMYANCRPGA
jgi:membrane-bound inhibitor of C-type lysozyme